MIRYNMIRCMYLVYLDSFCLVTIKALIISFINTRHMYSRLYVCHIVIIYCTHCSITLEDWLMLLVMVDWRMLRYISRMEWMLMVNG